MRIYRPINNIERTGSDPLNELKLTVDYDKGGVSYLSGNIRKRGIYLWMKPVHRDGLWETCTISFGADIREDGFRILLKELNRNSAKQVEAISQKIEPLADKIAEMWNTSDFNGINKIVKEVI